MYNRSCFQDFPKCEQLSLLLDQKEKKFPVQDKGKPEIMSWLELVYRTLAGWVLSTSLSLHHFPFLNSFPLRTDSHHHLLLNTCPSMFSLYTSFSMLSNVRTELLSDCVFLSVGASAGWARKHRKSWEDRRTGTVNFISCLTLPFSPWFNEWYVFIWSWVVSNCWIQGIF